MFFRFFSHIKFLLKSTNQHGVHSPFVYSFVTKGLYQKNTKSNILEEYQELKNLSKKEQKILSKIVNYFKIDKIHFDLNNKSITLNENHKLLYLSNLNELKPNYFNKKNENYFIIIENIYRDKNSIKNWKKLIQHKEATVTIDLFYYGLIFFRKEQEKEHFIIRA